MRNKLFDLNNHLFEQLERLNDDELTGEELYEEINRAKAITSVAAKIIDNGSLVLQAQKVKLEYDRCEFKPIQLLEQGNPDKWKKYWRINNEMLKSWRINKIQ